MHLTNPLLGIVSFEAKFGSDKRDRMVAAKSWIRCAASVTIESCGDVDRHSDGCTVPIGD